MIPVAQHAQTLEIRPLLVDLRRGIGAALGLHLVARQAAAKLLFNGVFDRQTVTVPTGNVSRIKAAQLTCLDDHVLQNFVDRMSHVNLTVGIRRTVVQHKFRRPGARQAQPLVETVFVPVLDPLRFALGQVAAHGEGGVWQIQRGPVIGFFGCGGVGVIHGMAVLCWSPEQRVQ